METFAFSFDHIKCTATFDQNRIKWKIHLLSAILVHIARLKFGMISRIAILIAVHTRENPSDDFCCKSFRIIQLYKVAPNSYVEHSGYAHISY